MLARRRWRAELLDRPVEDDPRCSECGGVCCRSFVSVPLSAREYGRLRELGARRLVLSLLGPHRLVIDGGCEFLAGGRCSIYEDRPDCCRRFVCVEPGGTPRSVAGPPR